MIAVKDGLLLIALIMEFPMERDLMDRIELLYEQCKIRGTEEKQREEYDTFSRTGSHTVCERCGATLDYGEKCDCAKD